MPSRRPPSDVGRRRTARTAAARPAWRRGRACRARRGARAPRASRCTSRPSDAASWAKRRLTLLRVVGSTGRNALPTAYAPASGRANAGDGAQERVGHLRDDARAVAGAGVGADRAAVLEVPQRVERRGDDVVSGGAAKGRDHREAAGVLLVGRVVQALRGGNETEPREGWSERHVRPSSSTSQAAGDVVGPSKGCRDAWCGVASENVRWALRRRWNGSSLWLPSRPCCSRPRRHRRESRSRTRFRPSLPQRPVPSIHGPVRRAWARRRCAGGAARGRARCRARPRPTRPRRSTRTPRNISLGSTRMASKNERPRPYQMR